jgi:hypothetical protein
VTRTGRKEGEGEERGRGRKGRGREGRGAGGNIQFNGGEGDVEGTLN